MGWVDWRAARQFVAVLWSRRFVTCYVVRYSNERISGSPTGQVRLERVGGNIGLRLGRTVTVVRSVVGGGI